MILAINLHILSLYSIGPIVQSSFNAVRCTLRKFVKKNESRILSLKTYQVLVEASLFIARRRRKLNLLCSEAETRNKCSNWN